MRFLLVLIVCIFAVAFLSGCSGTHSDASNANTAPPPEIPAAEYTDADAALADGIRLLDNGQTERAIEVLNRAVEINPDLADAYFRLGIAHSLIEYRDQMAAREEINVDDNSNENADAKRTKTAAEQAFEKAVDAYKKRIDANDEDHAAYYNLGRSYNKLNKDEDAAKALRTAVKLSPEDTDYQTELGSILIKLAKYPEAVGTLKKAVELDPDNLEAVELLEKAEAGRKRVQFTTLPKDDNRSTNSNTETDADEPASNTASPSRAPAPARTPARPAASPAANRSRP